MSVGQCSTELSKTDRAVHHTLVGSELMALMDDSLVTEKSMHRLYFF